MRRAARPWPDVDPGDGSARARMTSQDGQPHPTPDETPTPADAAEADDLVRARHALAPDDRPVPVDPPTPAVPPAADDAAVGWARHTAATLEERWAEPTLQAVHEASAGSPDRTGADAETGDIAGSYTDLPAGTGTAVEAAMPDEDDVAVPESPGGPADLADEEPVVENAFVGDVAADAEYEECVVPPLAAAAPSVFPRLAAEFEPAPDDRVDGAPTADGGGPFADVPEAGSAPAAPADPVAPAAQSPPVGLLDGLQTSPTELVPGATADIASRTNATAANEVSSAVGTADVVGSYQSHFLEGGEDEPEYVAHVEPAETATPPNHVAAEAATAGEPARSFAPVTARVAPAPAPAPAPADIAGTADAAPRGTFARRRKPRGPAGPPHHRVPAVASVPILDAPAAEGRTDEEPTDDATATAAESPSAVGDPMAEASTDDGRENLSGDPAATASNPDDAADPVAAEGSDDAVAALDAAEDAEDAADAAGEAYDPGSDDGHGHGDEDHDDPAEPHADEHEREAALAAAGSTGGAWTIPLLCAGVAVIACCVVIPQADAHRRLAYERAALRADLEAVQTQVATNDEFLRKLAGDPTLAERLAHRQLNLQRPGTRVLPIRHGEPGTSPFDLVQVPPPPAMDPYQPLGGRLAAVCRDARTRLYAMGAGLFLLAAGLVLGAGGAERVGRHRRAGSRRNEE